MTGRSLPKLVDSLVELRPGTAEAEGPQRAIEGLLMDVLRSGGREAGERLVESLTACGCCTPKAGRVALHVAGCCALAACA